MAVRAKRRRPREMPRRTEPSAAPAGEEPSQPAGPRPADCLAGGGEMGALHRALDWAATPVGPVAGWPQSLRTAVSICLNSRFPILLWWGPELVNLYNDALRPMLGQKHPRNLGRPGADGWAEIWDIVGPMLANVLRKGESSWSEDQLLPLDRHGFTEECYFTFSYSPIAVEDGIGGVFTAATETTSRVLRERRLRALRDLAKAGGEADTPDAALAAAVGVLAADAHDVPFALAFLPDSEGAPRLVARAGVEAAQGDAVVGAVGREALAPRDPRVLDLAGLQLRAGPWPEPLRQAMALPLRDDRGQPWGALVVGASPRLAMDEEYRDFLVLAAAHVSQAVAKARAHEAERRRAEALAELDRAKTAFFSNVSHEFRTPLTLMLGPLEDALRDPSLEQAPEQRERLELAHRNSLRLLKLVNNLLDFARLEAGRLEASFEPTDLAALTRDLASGFRSAFERAGLRLEVDCPPLPEPVFVDREMWEKVVLNLVSNAFKFTFTGGVAVRLRAEAGEAVLRVEDSGIGIPAEELPRLFQRFHRVREARSRTHEGSGIGLALVQELARMHGGTVTVASEVDHGSTFTVRVPLGMAHLSRARVGAPRSLASTASRAEAFVGEAERWLVAPPGAAAAGAGPVAATPRAPTAHDQPRGQVLVADDNADLRQYLTGVLGVEHDVEAVADGSSALAAAKARRPDLVLLDVMMPGLDGFEVLRELRRDAALRDVPVVLLSARAGEESKVEGLEAGADDYLVKPFSARELQARVRVHLELARLRRLHLEAERAARHAAEQARRQTEGILTSITDGFVAVDQDWRVLYINPAGERISHVRREEVLGKVLWDAVPEARGTPIHRRCLQAMAGQEPVTFEEYYAPLGIWLEARLYPSPEGLSAYYTDITARKRSERELHAALDQLRDIDKVKTNFLNMVAHELRTPLTPISLQLEILQQETGLDPKRRRSAEVLARNFRRLMRLVDDTLDVARLQSGRLTITPQPRELGALLSEAVEAYSDVAASRGVALGVAVEAPLHVDVDADRLAQVMANLLSNALRLTPAGGRVQVRGARRGATAVVEVQDTGPGLTREQQDRLFQPFSQVHDDPRNRGGTGLGLYICRGLVEAHGGRIWADSAGVGRGTTFAFTLPMGPVRTPPPSAAPAGPAAG